MSAETRPPEPDRDAWAGDRVERWLRAAPGLERQMAPISDLLFAAARLTPGQAVLDVGCGTGPTTWRAAELVGPSGRVTGLDVSAPMLAAARAAAPAQGPETAPIEWVEADATTWRADAAIFDVVISRFGVMFFADPPAAFTNLARSTRPGGRLHVAVWVDRRRIPLFEVPLAAALDARRELALGEPREMPPPPDAGASSLGDEQHVRRLLDDAGWADVAVERHRLLLPLAGGAGPEDAAVATLDFGPTRTVTADLDDGGRAQVQQRIAAALAPHLVDGRVMLDAEVLVVSATRPGA